MNTLSPRIYLEQTPLRNQIVGDLVFQAEIIDEEKSFPVLIRCCFCCCISPVLMNATLIIKSDGNLYCKETNLICPVTRDTYIIERSMGRHRATIMSTYPFTMVYFKEKSDLDNFIHVIESMGTANFGVVARSYNDEVLQSHIATTTAGELQHGAKAFDIAMQHKANPEKGLHTYADQIPTNYSYTIATVSTDSGSIPIQVFAAGAIQR